MQALQRLTEAAEKAKMELSSVAQTSISLPFITATADGPKHIESQMSRAKFESICSDLLDRCRIPVEQALKDAKLKLSDLNEVKPTSMAGDHTHIMCVYTYICIHTLISLLFIRCHTCCCADCMLWCCPRMKASSACCR